MANDKKKIVVKVQNESIMVYDEVDRDRIDLFKNDEVGVQKVLDLVKSMLED